MTALTSIVVYQDELAFVVPPSHSLARLRSVRLRQLGSESFIAHHVEFRPYRQRVLQTFRKRRAALHMPVELPTIRRTIKKFVAMGNGVALLPALSVDQELARGELVRVTARISAFVRLLRLVHRRDATLSHAARAFLEIAEAQAKRQPGRYLFKAER